MLSPQEFQSKCQSIVDFYSTYVPKLDLFCSVTLPELRFVFHSPEEFDMVYETLGKPSLRIAHEPRQSDYFQEFYASAEVATVPNVYLVGVFQTLTEAEAWERSVKEERL